MRRFFILLSVLLFALPSFGQNLQSLGAKNTVIKISGMLLQDSISSVFTNLDTATVRAAFPTQRMFGRVGFANGLPYIFNGTNWIRMYGIDTSGLSNRINAKENALGYVPEDLNNRVSVLTGASDKYASDKAAYDYANGVTISWNAANKTFSATNSVSGINLGSAVLYGLADSAKTVFRSDSTTKYFTPRQVDSLFNTIQTITSDITITVTNGVKWLIVNPSTTAASVTVTAPPSPRTGDILQISFGGTLTSGEVVSNFTFSPNTGQSVLQASTPSLVEAGETITYRFYNSKWYRL